MRSLVLGHDTVLPGWQLVRDSLLLVQLHVGDTCKRGIHVVIYMHTMHAWLTVQVLWQMHGRTLQAVHMLIVCMGIFSVILK